MVLTRVQKNRPERVNSHAYLRASAREGIELELFPSAAMRRKMAEEEVRAKFAILLVVKFNF